MRKITTFAFLLLAFTFSGSLIGAEKAVRIGAVASGKKKEAFEKLAALLTSKGYPASYTSYPDYDALVEALDAAKIDIAWNSPLAHARYHVKNQCSSQTLAMRTGDLNLRHVMIARADSGVAALGDLKGKRLILDKSKYQHELVSGQHLEDAGVDLEKVTLVQGESESPARAMQALADGKADAAVIRASAWRKAKVFQKEHPTIKPIWTSPGFNHCVFTAASDFDESLGKRFSDLITTLDATDPTVAEFNRVEGTREWVPGDSAGFESLVKALQEKEAESKAAAGQP